MAALFPSACKPCEHLNGPLCGHSSMGRRWMFRPFVVVHSRSHRAPWWCPLFDKSGRPKPAPPPVQLEKWSEET